jgi:hypothetical protein
MSLLPVRRCYSLLKRVIMLFVCVSFFFICIYKLPCVSTLPLSRHLLDNSILLRRPLAENLTPNPHLVAAQRNGALEIRTHAHAQLQPVGRPPELGSDLVADVAQGDEILVLVPRRRRLAPRNGTDGHQAEELEVRTGVEDVSAQGEGVGGLDARLGLLAARVDLDHDTQLLGLAVALQQRAAPFFQLVCLFGAVDAAHAPQVRNLLGQLLALVRLQAADHVPADGAREQLGLVEELLDVVFAKVRVQRVRGLVQGKNVVCGFQLGDGDEADLVGVG